MSTGTDPDILDTVLAFHPTEGCSYTHDTFGRRVGWSADGGGPQVRPSESLSISRVQTRSWIPSSTGPGIGSPDPTVHHEVITRLECHRGSRLRDTYLAWAAYLAPARIHAWPDGQ